MITTRCPECAHEVKTPESFLGKRIRCKSAGCQRVFVVKQALPPLPVEALPSADDSNLDLNLDFESLPTRNFKTPPSMPGDGRYSTLQRYLRWAKLAALVQFLIVVMICCCLLLVTVVFQVTRNAIDVAIVPILESAAISLLLGTVGYLVYVFTLAAVEFANVIVDIESNTRSQNST